jgi:hypothetical protein
MKRKYKSWEIKYQGRDKQGSYWMAISPPDFLEKGTTGDPDRRHREILSSLAECKKYIDKMSEENIRRNPNCMRKNPVRLHNTFQPDIYYTSFRNLPRDVQEVLLNTEPELEKSGYTVYEYMGFIRNIVRFDGRVFKAEITLGSVDIKNSDYQYDSTNDEYYDDSGRIIDAEEYAEQMLKDLYEVIEIENIDVYLTEIDEPRMKSKSNPRFIQDEEGFEEAEKILATFIKNAGGKDYAAELISQEIHGELEEFTARGLKGYMAYGNREALIFLDDIEEPFSLYVDYYGDRPVIVWG